MPKGEKNGKRDMRSKKDGRKSAPMSTAAEMEARVTVVTQLLLDGKRRASICAYCKEQWDIEPSTVDNLIRKATGVLKEENRATRVFAQENAYAMMREIYERAMEKGDMRSAIAAVKIILEMLGLTDADKDVNVHTTVYLQDSHRGIL